MPAGNKVVETASSYTVLFLLCRLIEEGKGKEREGSLDDDPIWRAEREVEDLNSLLPEVRAKMEDTLDMMKQDCKALKDAAIQKMMDREPVRT